MPLNNPHPPFAVLAEFDARAWSGVDLFKRGAGGAAVPFPTFTANTEEGIYEDILDLLNGRGSQDGRDIQSDGSANWTAGGAAGTFTVSLVGSDRIYFASSAENFTIAASANNVYWGIPAAGQAVTAGGAGYTAPKNWTRGNFIQHPLTIVPAAGSPFELPSVDARMQDLVVGFREVGVVADADDNHATDCLETLDNDAYDNANRRIRWGLTDDGHVYWAASSVASVSNIVWLDTDFRDALGFDGTETVDSSTYSALDLVIATNPCKYAWFPTRPLVSLDRRSTEVSSTRRLSNGGWSGNKIGRFGGWELSAYLDGPADSVDLSRHVPDLFLDVASFGSRVSLYQSWGDQRRARPLPNNGAYSLLYTPEEGGYRGRLRLRLDPATGSEIQVSWPNQIRRRSPIAMLFTDYEGGQ